MNVENQPIRASHLFVHDDCHVVVQEAEALAKGKTNVQITYGASITPVQHRMPGQPPMTVYSYAFVCWDTTQGEFKKFRERLMLSLGKVVQ